jgi:hypothetical protein
MTSLFESVVLGFSMPADLVPVVDRAARRSLESRASWMRRIIVTRLQLDGFLDDEGCPQNPPPQPPAKARR